MRRAVYIEKLAEQSDMALPPLARLAGLSIKFRVFLALILGAAFVAGGIAAKLHSRLVVARANCSDVPCDHFTARMFAIESAIAQLGNEPRYLFIGDSIVEMADLPVICGRRPVNAGISWATVRTFQEHGRRLADASGADFIIVALGTNDAHRLQLAGFETRFAQLIGSLGRPVIAVPLPGGPVVTNAEAFNAAIDALNVPKASRLDTASFLPDGVHLDAKTYVHWKRSILLAAENPLCRY